MFACWCVCLWVSCSSAESQGDQTVSQLPWEGSSGCDREEKAKYLGSNTLFSLSHNKQPRQAQTAHTERSSTGQGLGAGLKLRPASAQLSPQLSPHTLFLYLLYPTVQWNLVMELCVQVLSHLKVTTVICLLAEQTLSSSLFPYTNYKHIKKTHRWFSVCFKVMIIQ